MKFLINTLTHWEEPPRARHQVTHALSENHKVVFISANKKGLPHLRSEKINKNLTLVVPHFPIGHKFRYRLSFFNAIYQTWLFSKLYKTYRDYTVLNFDFTAKRIFKYFNKVIYYCNDSFSAISKHINPYFIARYHKSCEEYIASHARFCIGVSPKLADNLSNFNPDSFVIPLGSPDLGNYKINYKNTPNSGVKISIVLMGIIRRYNISVNVINLLLANNDITIALIGPVEERFIDMIEHKERLIIKGPMLGEELYKELSEYDVSIAPYVSRLTEDDNSGVGTGNKLYQYLALGKPVVISRMAGLNDIDLPNGFIYVANKEEEFPELVIKAHRENSPELIKQRIDYAKNNTWKKRMERLIGLIKENGID